MATNPEISKNKQAVDLSLHATNLKNVAGAFKGTSDPFAVVTLLPSSNKEQPRILGQTEVIKNTLSPTWVKTFRIEYEFGKPTHINIGVFDEVRKSKHDKPMGSASFEIGDILGSKGNIKAKKLKNSGQLFAVVHKASVKPGGILHLALEGQKLANVDGMFGKSDPFFELARRADSPSGGFVYNTVYTSKAIRNDLNPKWAPVEIDLEKLCNNEPEKQPLLIRVMDHEKSGKHKLIGQIEATVDTLLKASQKSLHVYGSSQPMTLINRSGKARGTLVVVDASIRPKSGRVTIGGGGPASSSSSSKRISPSSSSVSASGGRRPDRSAASPVEAATASMAAASIAAAIPTPSQTAAPSPVPMPVAPREPYVPPGVGMVSQPSAGPYVPASSQRPTFIDYISGGCELQMCVAIDFTGSNGDPRKPGTLHYQHRDSNLNDYEKALTSVGGIVAKYDYDQRFPVWGFGAKFGGVIQHCFQLGDAPEAHLVRGILEAYRGTFRKPLTMSGPTLFQDVIRFASDRAARDQDWAVREGRQAYTVLLILTDGSVSDVEATKNALIAASQTPLSVVIVGIGTADFSTMQFLDDFNPPPPARDITQFVEFNRYKHDKNALTSATLEEIPDQLVNYFLERNILPSPSIDPKSVNVTIDPHNEQEDIDIPLNFTDNEIMLDGSTSNLFRPSNLGGFDTASQYFSPPAPAPAGPPSPYNPHAQNPPPSAPGSHPSFYGRQTSQRSLRVRVPPGVRPGMQIQLSQPSTGQLMEVTVPPGVAPGGEFEVQY